ncbi:hypothetical protein MMC14_005837 [Varicellaria rhodocarpa]|nr:hypothetical protein [Varicellaria rhodocarpa]
MSSPHAEHGRMRRIFAPAFTEKAVREREPLVLRHTNFLMDRLAQEAAKASPVNIKDWFHYTTFDLIGEFELSESFDCLRSDRNHYLIDTIQNAMKTLTRVVVPRILGLESIWPWIFPSLSMQKRKPTERRLSYWTHQRLKEGDVNNKNDLMSLVCRSHSENNLLLPEIENSLSDFMIAGSETIATTLTSIFYFLVRDPEIHRQVSNEVRNSFPREADITTDSVAELSLLNAVIKEAMRLCPSLPMVLPRITTEPGATVCGYWLPPGTYVSFCQLAAYSSRLNFASPERFVPRRWLPDSKLSPHNARVFQPFSVGPRNCIGKGLGLAAVRTIVAKTLWNFDVARGEEDWEWTSQKSFFVWEKRPLYVGISQVNH